MIDDTTLSPHVQVMGTNEKRSGKVAGLLEEEAKKMHDHRSLPRSNRCFEGS